MHKLNWNEIFINQLLMIHYPVKCLISFEYWHVLDEIYGSEYIYIYIYTLGYMHIFFECPTKQNANSTALS